MIHQRSDSSGAAKPATMLGAYLLFGIVTLGIGSALMILQHHTRSAIDAARNWVPVFGVVERAAFERDDENGRSLDLQFRYDFGGRTYRSTRLDLLPGRMGDDDSWEKEILKSSPVGATVTCFVNPHAPEEAVLDREHGLSGARNLTLMAFPFLAISAAMLMAALNRLLDLRGTAREGDGNIPATIPAELEVPPRHFGLGLALATLVHTPKGIQLAWAFLVGFAYVFTILGGPIAFSDLLPAARKHVAGEVTRVATGDQVELKQQVREYEFQFKVGDTMRTGRSHSAWHRYAVGDSVEVVYDPRHPDSARIAGTRRYFAPIWVIAIPLAVVALLGLGIVGSYMFNFRVLSLLRRGRIAMADPRVPESDATTSPDTAPSRETLVRHEFCVNGARYLVDLRAGAVATASVPVLYAPEMPTRNCALDASRIEMLTRRKYPWPSFLLGVFAPILSIGAMVWLWNIR